MTDQNWGENARRLFRCNADQELSIKGSKSMKFRRKGFMFMPVHFA